MMLSHLDDLQFSAWLAGFFDGEGCVYLPPVTGVQITIANTQEDLIDAIYSRINLGVRTQTFYSKVNWKTKHCITIRRYDEATVFLQLILPFLTIKKPKALEAISRADSCLARRQANIDRNKEIIAMVMSGMSHKEVALRFGVCRSSVTLIMTSFRKRGEVTYLSRPRKRKSSSTETYTKLAEKVSTITVRQPRPRDAQAGME